MEGYVEIKEIVRVIVKRWWVLVLVPILASLLAYGVSNSQPPVYEAKATLMVGKFMSASQIDRDDIVARDAFAKSYAEIANRQPVLDAVVKSLSLTSSWETLKSRVDVSVVPDTQFIEIVTQASTPAGARDIAGEVAHQLILLSPSIESANPTNEFVQNEMKDLQSRIDTGHKRLAALQTEATTNISAERLSEIKTEVDTLQRLTTDWEETYSRLLAVTSLDLSQNTLTLIEDAHASEQPVSPRTTLNSLLGAAVGFFLALGFIFVLNQFDKKKPQVSKN